MLIRNGKKNPWSTIIINNPKVCVASKTPVFTADPAAPKVPIFILKKPIAVPISVIFIKTIYKAAFFQSSASIIVGDRQVLEISLHFLYGWISPVKWRHYLLQIDKLFAKKIIDSLCLLPPPLIAVWR